MERRPHIGLGAAERTADLRRLRNFCGRRRLAEEMNANIARERLDIRLAHGRYASSARMRVQWRASELHMLVSHMRNKWLIRV